MFEHIVLGIIQGIVEWLPISSEGMIVLVKTNFFPSEDNFATIIHQALFLHLGTFFAALVYFNKDVAILIKALFQFKSQSKDTQNLLIFLLWSTIISGLLGIVLLKIFSHFFEQFSSAGKGITALVGCLLFITAYLEIKALGKNKVIKASAGTSSYRNMSDLKIIDGIILGIVQGCAALPGLSRSGLTVSALLLRKFDKAYALKLSFLMSLPIVLAGNIILNFNNLQWSLNAFVGLFFAFAFGLATIHLLLRLAQKINFGYFLIFLGALTIISVFI